MATMTWLVILLLCLGRSRAKFPGISDRSDPDLEDGLLQLLLSLHQEEFFDTLLIYGEDCVFHSLTKSLKVSTVLVSNGSTTFDWDFGTLAMILCCSPEAEKEATHKTLRKLQRNRRLIYIREDTQPDLVCASYSLKEQYNIALVRENFAKSKVIYACRYLQDFKLERVSTTESKPIYIETFQNMHRRPIKAMPDLLAPRSMVYQDESTGEKKIMGYVANLFTNFAHKLNATLELELPENSSYKEILRKIDTDQLDMGITLQSSLHETYIETTSYPYVQTTYCLMLQFPDDMPYYEIYEMIVDPLVLGIIFLLFCILSLLLIYSRKKSWQDLSLANVLLNDVSLRGLLGQSFPFPLDANKHLKLIFIILCFASVLMTTMYEAYLQSYFTGPPSEPYLESFQDIGKFHQKLAITAIEVKILTITNNSAFREINKKDLEVFDDWQECLRLRDSFNLSYSYVVTGDRWSAYAEQQKLFKEPLFYFDHDLCFSRLVFMSIPLRRFLPYRHLFEDHILRLNEFGLVRYWKGHSFFDMVRLGITPLEDLSRSKPIEEAIEMEDVSRILQFYLGAMVMSIFCFLLELLVGKWCRLRRGRRE